MIDSQRAKHSHPQSLVACKEGRVPQSHEEIQSYQHLLSAIRSGQKELARSLIEQGTPVNVNPCLSGHRKVSPLHLAIHLGCPALVRILLEYGASVNKLWFEETPITLSVKLRKFSITDLLLTADDIANAGDGSVFKLNHFHIACLRGQISTARKLIRRGANVNGAVSNGSFFWSGYTPLHLAVESQSVEMVQLLLDCGANLKIQDGRSFTPLHLAHEMRNGVIIDVLLTAHVYHDGNPMSSDGLSHFHIACTRNNVDIVRYFLNQGCDVEFCTQQDGKWAQPPLELAIEYECTDVVELLLLHDAKLINDLSRPGNVLSWAYFIGNAKIIDLLLSQNIHRNVNNLGVNKRSVLHKAFVKFDHDKIIQLLTQNNGELTADLDTPIWDSFTPLHVAAMHSSVLIIRLLQESGANVTMRDSKMRTPLHIAFYYMPKDELEMVISDLLDLDQNPSDHQELTHFHIVCTTRRVDLIRRFLENGGNLNHFVANDSVKWAGYGPLHFATRFKQLETVRFLLDSGANVFAGNGSCQTLIDIAIMNLNVESHGNNVLAKIRHFRILERILSDVEELRGINSLDCRGFSMLHIFCAFISSASIGKIAEYVESHAETINQIINCVDSEYHGYAPIHFAIADNNDALVEWLLQNGANIHIKDPRGFSPLQDDMDSDGSFGILEANPGLLWVPENPFDIHGYSYFHQACILGHLNIAQSYLQSGVDINLPMAIGVWGEYYARTPLHSVVEKSTANAVETVKFLLNNGADPIAKDAYLNTPLHCIIDTPHTEIIDLLIERGADVNSQNIFGQTPLLLVCLFSNESPETRRKIVSLLEHGADINIQDNSGATPIRYSHVIMAGDNVEDSSSCVTVLLEQAKKLEVLGRELSDENRKSRRELYRSWQMDEHFNETEFVEQCTAEIERMKTTKIGRYTNLYDVLSKNPNQMASLSENLSFLEIIQSNEFVRNFAIYGYLLKLQYKIGLIRKPLLERCNVWMRRHAGLSPESSEKILEHLDNSDLQNIIKSEDVMSNS